MFYMMAMVSEFAVGVKDGLDECEISQSEIVSQSDPRPPNKFLLRPPDV